VHTARIGSSEVIEMKRTILFIAMATLSLSARASLQIVTCESEWASLAAELGGEMVNAESATTPFQDVHYIQARPSLISKVRRADLVICTGADLEVGWLPLLLRQAGNADVQPGRPGFLTASDYVDLLEKPTSVDRSQGDIHPYGNPHIQTDPRNIAKVAAALADRLSEVDPDNAAYYRQRYEDFSTRWQSALDRWTAAIEGVRGMEIVVHHRAWVYLANWAGLVEVAALEPKPGLPPSAASLAQLLDVVKAKNVRLIIRAVYKDEQASEWLTDRTGIPHVVMPHTVGSVDGTDDLFSMFDVIVATLVEASS
jgi:zinc/manganese transport system substrate-binding protein